MPRPETGNRRHGFPAVPGRDNRPGGRRPRGTIGDATTAHAPGRRSGIPDAVERGGQHRARRGHGGGTGTTGGDGQARFPALPRDRHPSSGHPLPDMPPHPRLPARESQRCPDRALPPGPPRNTRPPLLPVASHTQNACRRKDRCPARASRPGRTTPQTPAAASPQRGHPQHPPRRGEAPSCGDQPGCAPDRPGAPDRLQAVPGNIRICRK